MFYDLRTYLITLFFSRTVELDAAAADAVGEGEDAGAAEATVDDVGADVAAAVEDAETVSRCC